MFWRWTLGRGRLFSWVAVGRKRVLLLVLRWSVAIDCFPFEGCYIVLLIADIALRVLLFPLFPLFPLLPLFLCLPGYFLVVLWFLRFNCPFLLQRSAVILYFLWESCFVVVVWAVAIDKCSNCLSHYFWTGRVAASVVRNRHRDFSFTEILARIIWKGWAVESIAGCIVNGAVTRLFHSRRSGILCFCSVRAGRHSRTVLLLVLLWVRWANWTLFCWSGWFPLVVLFFPWWRHHLQTCHRSIWECVYLNGWRSAVTVRYASLVNCSCVVWV